MLNLVYKFYAKPDNIVESTERSLTQGFCQIFQKVKYVITKKNCLDLLHHRLGLQYYNDTCQLSCIA